MEMVLVFECIEACTGDGTDGGSDLLQDVGELGCDFKGGPKVCLRIFREMGRV
ncbi:hypothetical protein PGT21_010525 [Puccinia graminis f. sp. tritici]|uniref:Uncharacterized protein n=1 Tax=Puccinia graminis f. sp. tritici TaxID=56615 RepID=A0A5B0PTS5_PUCGR|nr:hypothetical protein PGT21_010525 [Puccinia graminis f. sp. tritici]